MFTYFGRFFKNLLWGYKNNFTYLYEKYGPSRILSSDQFGILHEKKYRGTM